MNRGNLYASPSSILEPVALEPGITLDSLIWNSSEHIQVTSAKVAVTVEKAVRAYTIKDVLVGLGSAPLRARGRIAVHRGAKLHVRVVLRKYEGGTKSLNYTFRIPRNRPVSGTLVFASANALGDDFYPYGGDFESQLDFFQHFPRNDQLVGGIARRRSLASERRTRLDGYVRGLPRGRPPAGRHGRAELRLPGSLALPAIRDRRAPVAAERLRAQLHARRRLAALVLGPVDQRERAVHDLGIEPVRAELLA